MSDAKDERKRLNEIALIARMPEGHGWLRQSEWQRLLDVQKARTEAAERRADALKRERDALAAGLDRDTRSRYALIDQMNALERALREVQTLIPDRHDPDYDRDVLSLESALDSIGKVVNSVPYTPPDQPE